MDIGIFKFRAVDRTNEGTLAKMLRRFRNIVVFSGLLIIITEFILIGIIIVFMMFCGSYIVEKEEVRYLGKEEALAFKEDLVYKEDDSKLYFKTAFPLPKKYKVDYSDSFGNGRSYGPGGTTVSRKHEGIDMFCDRGTPIIAVESGKIMNMGWNELGGWRITILNDNGTRSWYYAHMRKIHPYVIGLKKDSKISAGQVIGYVGSTGYSNKIKPGTLPEEVTNTNNIVDNMFPAHLHIGIYDGSGGANSKNPFPLLKILEENKIEVFVENDEYKALKMVPKLK